MRTYIYTDLWLQGSPYIRRCGAIVCWPGMLTRNRSTIPTTGYGLASAQIQAYSDRMTRFSHTGSNPACPAGAIQKNAGTQPGWPYSVYSYNQRAAGWPDVYIIYCIYFVYFYNVRPNWPDVFLYRLPARSSRFGDTPKHRYIYICKIFLYVFVADRMKWNKHTCNEMGTLAL